MEGLTESLLTDRWGTYWTTTLKKSNDLLKPVFDTRNSNSFGRSRLTD